MPMPKVFDAVQLFLRACSTSDESQAAYDTIFARFPYEATSSHEGRALSVVKMENQRWENCSFRCRVPMSHRR